MTDILITEFMGEGIVADLARDFDVCYQPDLWERPADLAVAIADVPALIVRNNTQVSAGIIAAAEKLRVVGRLGVGLDNIDLAACKSRDILVCPATGANALAVAEYVIGTTMSLLRLSYNSSAQLVDGKWPRAALRGGGEITGRTLGLIGYGNIGQETGRLARAVGMKTIAYDPVLPEANPAWAQAGRVSLAELIARADVITMHVPLTPETRDLIGRAEFASMKPGAILINAARGGVVNEVALADALRSGHLRGAAVDVFSTEPITREIGQVFAGLDNVILTPHIAAGTLEADQRVDSMIAGRVRAALEHKQP